MLYIWIDSMCRAKLHVPPSLTITKAKSIASSHSISEIRCQGILAMVKSIQSAPWIAKDVPSRRGSKKVNKNNLELLAALEELHGIIARYDPENVYNMDETSLFFQLLRRYSLLMPNEDISTTKGKRKVKDWVSLIACTNASGSHKIPCALIGKPQEPACIKGRQWPIPHFNQAKAWMDVETCCKWFNEVIYPEVKKRTGRHVLLLMDNAPGHFEAFKHTFR